MDDKLVLLLSYVLPPFGSIYIFLTDKKDNPNMKFHAMQSLFLWIIIWVSSVTGIGPLLLWAYSCYIGYKLYTGEEANIPMLTDFTRNQIK